jgi:Zinc-finger domain of monoamine-oxidase A repressor R1
VSSLPFFWPSFCERVVLSLLPLSSLAVMAAPRVDLLAIRAENMEKIRRMKEAAGLADVGAAERLGIRPDKPEGTPPKRTNTRKRSAPTRWSLRVKREPPRYSKKEADAQLGELEDGGTLRRQSKRARMQLLEGGDFCRKEEVYTQTHLDALGTCLKPWPHVNFEKTYDKARGTTCHQCRQKTIDKKARCTAAACVGSLSSFFCGTCLQNRYGENLDEVLAKKKWECPKCRDLCNCSGSGCFRCDVAWFFVVIVVAPARADFSSQGQKGLSADRRYDS